MSTSPPPAPAERSPILAFRYMTRFRCLGGECEDTCCAEWNVSVDGSHYHALRERFLAAGESERFEAAFALKRPEEQRPFALATIRMRPAEEGRRCPLLDAAGLCEVQQRWGDETLADVCSFYPRHLTEVGGRLELAGALSCPEVARRALLDDDGLELALLEGDDASIAGRTPVLQRPAAERESIVDELRGVAWLILDGNAPLGARLYQLAFVAAEAEALIEAGAGGGSLGLELEPFLDDEVLRSLAGELAGEPRAGAAAMGVVLAQLARLRSVVRSSLRPLLDETLAGAASLGLLRITRKEAGDGHADELSIALSPGFHEALDRRSAAIPPSVHDAIERWLGRFARERIFRELARPDVLFDQAVADLSLRLAVVRLLLLVHPAAVEGPDPLARWLIALVHGVARVADHDPDVRAFLSGDARDHFSSLAALKELLPLLS